MKTLKIEQPIYIDFEDKYINHGGCRCCSNYIAFENLTANQISDAIDIIRQQEFILMDLLFKKGITLSGRRA